MAAQGRPGADSVATSVAGDALSRIAPGSTLGIGSLPHRNARHAAAFAFEAFDVPTAPSLPRRSPAESLIAQALAGVAGVTPGQYGTVGVDVDRLDPGGPVLTDAAGEHLTGLRTFLEHGRRQGHDGPVKWQFVGPISVGVALRRAGADPDTAFAVALAAVRHHLRAIHELVAAALPGAPQLVILDEPFADDLMSNDFPIAPDEGIDLLSTALATLERDAVVGVHCCGDLDVASLLAAGPRVLSMPAQERLVPLAGYLDRHLANGGWIAWGAIATEGPIGVGGQRAWQSLAALWCELVQRGCDAERLRAQCLVSPECGLGTHSTAVAASVTEALRDLSRSLRSESAAAKFVLGA